MNPAQHRREAGQDLIEFAMVLPLLLLLLLGIMEFGLAVFSYVSVANAAREGARYGIIHPGDTAGIEAATLAKVSDLIQDSMQITVSRPDDQTVQVDVVYDYSLITGPIVEAVGGEGVIPLHTVATMYVE